MEKNDVFGVPEKKVGKKRKERRKRKDEGKSVVDDIHVLKTSWNCVEFLKEGMGRERGGGVSISILNFEF